MTNCLRRCVPILSLLMAAMAFGVARLPAADWQAGTARVKITPDKLIWMSGYGSRNHPAEGKLTDIWAKALAIQDPAGQRAVLVTLDLVGIDRGLSQAICRRAKEQYQLERRQIALCTSHTHTGPAVGRNLAPLHYLIIDKQQQRLVDEYTKVLENKVVALIGDAVKDLGPAQLSHGSGKSTVAVNRRNNRPESAVPQLRKEGKLKGPFDHDVPVLAVRSDGKLKAVVFGYACHATVLSFYKWSGDYPGFAQMALEKAHPGCTALFWAGCGADQNPLPRRKVELAQSYGERLAAAVDQVLDSKMTPIRSRIVTDYKEIPLPLGKLPTKAEVEADTKSSNKYVVARAKMLLEQIEKNGKLDATYPYPVASWRLGDEVQFVILGGEVVVDYALRLKAELSGTKTWVAGYSNDVMAYIASRRVLREGGYEGAGAMVYYGLPTVWAPEVEKLIVDETHRQLKR